VVDAVAKDLVARDWQLRIAALKTLAQLPPSLLSVRSRPPPSLRLPTSTNSSLLTFFTLFVSTTATRNTSKPARSIFRAICCTSSHPVRQTAITTLAELVLYHGSALRKVSAVYGAPSFDEEVWGLIADRTFDDNHFVVSTAFSAVRPYFLFLFLFKEIYEIIFLVVIFIFLFNSWGFCSAKRRASHSSLTTSHATLSRSSGSSVCSPPPGVSLFLSSFISMFDLSSFL
jgi:hypothetical protein